ncbi:chitinase [Saccharopolyspora erythraea NRRL 2338]|uniref:Chitinase n=1 Tax=Saccharopolyspora erythraea TaxID=1836 RepID=A0ABP3P2R4_SACER|nr:glycosyl hydrolase [Saccharopolyspora erythraea]PFG98163.1 chitinase [Saccharopolyspora erythraea NRRL 2338]
MRKLPALATTMVVSAGIATGLWAAPGNAVPTNPVTVAPPSLPAGWYGSAPYVTPLYGNPPDLPKVMAETGQKTFQLTFIQAPRGGGGCTPTWDGTAPVSEDTAVARVIDGVRSAGGDVSVSIGGYGGRNLGQTCASAEDTANAYQQVIDKYALRAVDFNLEEPAYSDPGAVTKELRAAQILQHHNPGLYVSVTTVAAPGGTTPQGQNLLNTAKSLKFAPDNYSIMPFNGFQDVGAQIAVLEAFHGVLMNTFGWDSATAYAHEGASLMNGRSDFGEYYDQADFQALLDYAIGHGMSRYTFWSLNRDRQCTPPDNGQTSGTCSSVPQNPWEFTRLTAQFAQRTPALKAGVAVSQPVPARLPAQADQGAGR